MASPQLVRPERTTIGGGSLEICRMINGLWQRADVSSEQSDVFTAAGVMDSMSLRNFDTWDMADHYGDAELIVGQHNSSYPNTEKVAFTKWCPQETGDVSFENAEAAVDLALKRMNTSKIALMQYHIWDYTDDTYLHNLDHLRTLQTQGKIGLIGLTNTDAAHLQLLLHSGFSIATNQVPANVIDRRLTRGRLNQICLDNDVGILAYGTLLGGFISEKWLGQSEPKDINELNWSLRKYLRFIRAAGGWEPFQGVLQALDVIAKRHGVGIPAVATRYVLDIPSVKAVIVGCRLSTDSDKYAQRNLEAFSLKLTDEDMALIHKAQERLCDVPGDCGDEYRRAPFLTTMGDISQHVVQLDKTREVREAVAQGKRVEYSSGSHWEPIAGYCRAVRTGNVVRVSGTTANSPLPSIIPIIGGSSPGSQTVHILDIIARSLAALGSSLSDVVRTRIMVRDASACEEVARAHGWVFRCIGTFPTNTLVTAGLIGDEMLVEIEADAEINSGSAGVLRI